MRLNPPIKIPETTIKARKHTTNPAKQIAPSSSCNPKPIIKMPIAGKVLVPGIGIIIEIDISAIALMSISMMIPIPGTNTLPAIGIFIIGFGLQEDDGAICLAGLVVCFLALIVVSGILIGGFSLIDYLKESLTN